MFKYRFQTFLSGWFILIGTNGWWVLQSLDPVGYHFQAILIWLNGVPTL
jgi:hypothetical protein